MSSSGAVYRTSEQAGCFYSAAVSKWASAIIQAWFEGMIRRYEPNSRTDK